MAKKDKESKISNPRVNKLAGFVRDNLSRLYSNTFYTQPTNKKDLYNLKVAMDKSIDDIIKNDASNMAISNMTKLYTKIQQAQNNTTTIKNIEEVFEDKGLMDNILSSYMENKYLDDADRDIDLICKYMPKLLEALDTRKDNVLSADHFSKDFITATNESNINDETAFNKKFLQMKDKYELNKLMDEMYDNAAKYGEQFVYVVPYKKALEKLLKNRNNINKVKINTESGMILSESAEPYKMEPLNKELTETASNIKINLELSSSNMIESLILASQKSEKIKIKTYNESLNVVLQESIINDKLDEDAIKHKRTMDKTIDDDLDISGIYDSTARDGLISASDKKDKNTTLNINGCLVKKLKRSSVIPIYIEDICLGYYYIECDSLDPFKDATNNRGFNNSYTSMKNNINNKEDLAKRDQVLNYLANQLSGYIDAKFINSNQDLKKEIYMILKHNDNVNVNQSMNMRVTFIPPEDMIHMHFRKDPKTHRGISDLERAIIPAKLYCCLYTTNAIGVLTRGQDKRIYYVKQNVETNISKTLLNTINQIKKSNFGIRAIDNMDNILNITGRFNDWIIPTGNGDPPIQFEMMQGQNIEIKTELLNILEEMSVNSTDVPLELIQARQSIDYAVQLTMTNSKFLRKVYNRQSVCEEIFSRLCTKIYNAEYEEDDVLNVTLPPPMFLNITNTMQMLTNTNDFCEGLVNIEMADEEDDMTKVIYGKLLKKHYLGSYMDVDLMERLAIKARQQAALKKKQEA